MLTAQLCLHVFFFSGGSKLNNYYASTKCKHMANMMPVRLFACVLFSRNYRTDLDLIYY